MKEIVLNNRVIAYSYIFNPKYKKNEIVDRVDHIVTNRHWVKSDGYVFTHNPEEFSDIYEFCSNKCVEMCNDVITFKLHKWVSILRSNPLQPMELDIENKEPTYHNHKLMAEAGTREVPTYSFVYYVQMPDNLNGIDGNILFKDNDGNVLNYLPTENEVLIFNSNLSHAPIYAKNSTKNRIVLAGDFIIIKNSKNKSLI